MLNQVLWAINVLNHLGYVIDQPTPETIQSTPWSQVFRFVTNQGHIYLKQMAPLFAIEGRLISYLSDHVTTRVPTVLAIDEEANCFLMLDAGMPLREFFQMQYRISPVCEALTCYAAIQQQCISHVDHILSLGLPDWRLQRLPPLYESLISQENMLLSDGLTKEELTQLRSLQPSLIDLCMKLAAFGIPETIEHGDFHDNNVLIDDKRITVNDWGDATITHPFFSGVSWLESAKRNHGFDEQHVYYQKSLNAYLSVWSDFGNIAELSKAFELAKRIRPIVFAMSFSRINACKGIDHYPQYRGYIADALRAFMV
jgi:hypothetical protein